MELVKTRFCASTGARTSSSVDDQNGAKHGVWANESDRVGLKARRPSSMTTAVVPPLQLLTSRTLSPQTPRGGRYTPRTHREQLELTGDQLSEAHSAVSEIAEAIALLTARAERHRSEFVALVAAHEEHEEGAPSASAYGCPICLSDTIVDPLGCENGHDFCSECLRKYQSHSPRRRILCPLCRVAMGGPEG